MTRVARVTVAHIAVLKVTAHSVSTQRHADGRELGTLVDVLTDVVLCRCAVCDEPTTGGTPGECSTNYAVVSMVQFTACNYCAILAAMLQF